MLVLLEYDQVSGIYHLNIFDILISVKSHNNSIKLDTLPLKKLRDGYIASKLWKQKSNLGLPDFSSHITTWSFKSLKTNEETENLPNAN